MSYFQKHIPMESALVGCLYAAAPTGIFYGFSLYSAALQAQFDLSEGDLLNIATLPFAFGWTGPCWGRITQRTGPRLGLLLFGSIISLSYFLMYLVATRTISLGSPQVSLVVLNCTTYFGLMGCGSVSFSVPVWHYQRLRSKAVALGKSFVGLSGAAVAQLFWLWIGHNSDVSKDSPENLHAILVWAIVVAVCVVAGVCFIPPTAHPDPTRESAPRLNAIFWLLLVWGISTIFISIIADETLHGILAVALLVMLLFPVVLLVLWRPKGQQIVDSAGGACFESPVAMTFGQMLQTIEAWCFLLASLPALAGGFIISSSLSQILTAAGNASASALIIATTVFSAGNMLGRLTYMIPSEMFVRNGIPRPYFVIVVIILVAASQGLLMLLPHFGGSITLVAGGAFLGGYSFGSMWPLMVVITSELFGSKNLPQIYMFYDGNGFFLSNIIFVRLLTGSVYQAHVPEGSNICIGSGCYFLSHLAVIGTCVLGAVSAAIVGCKSSALYRDIQESQRKPLLSGNVYSDAV